MKPEPGNRCCCHGEGAREGRARGGGEHGGEKGGFQAQESLLIHSEWPVPCWVSAL